MQCHCPKILDNLLHSDSGTRLKKCNRPNTDVIVISQNDPQSSETNVQKVASSR